MKILVKIIVLIILLSSSNLNKSFAQDKIKLGNYKVVINLGY